MPERLTGSQVQDALADLEKWLLVPTEPDFIQAIFDFNSFSEAFAFVTRVALLAEKMNHHPTIHHAYKNVTLEMWTHDVGGLSDLDFKMAKAIEQFKC